MLDMIAGRQLSVAMERCVIVKIRIVVWLLNEVQYSGDANTYQLLHHGEANPAPSHRSKDY